MSDAAYAVSTRAEAKSPSRIAELKVSGHLMTLETGLFCVFLSPGLHPANDGSGLPGVRLSLPPRDDGRSGGVTISSFRQDGWMGGRDDAALVRVAAGPAQIMVTIYQSPMQPPEAAPRLQVLRLGADSQAVVPAQPIGAPAPSPALSRGADVIAHVQRTGDVAVRFDEWVGKVGSGFWIEGFGIAPRSLIDPAEIEYQAVLGRGWLSPWVDGGKFCGSRGMSLPLLGLRLRLRGKAAEAFDCSYAAAFVDGTRVGPLPAGETCEAESLAPLEAFKIVVAPKAGGGASGGPAPGHKPAAAFPAPRRR